MSTIAREILAFRNHLNTALTTTEKRTIAWNVLAREAEPAIERGWTGIELADMVMNDLGPNAENPGAIAVTTLRHLAGTPHPTATPSPEQYDDAERRARIANAATPEQVTHWANHIRQTIANTPTHGTTRG